MALAILRSSLSQLRWRSFKRTVVAWASVVLLLLANGTGRAVILFDTDNALANTTAPTGIYADSGWGFMGQFGGSLGTMIAPQYFITAQHIGVPSSDFISTAALNGGPLDIHYAIDTTANGGTGYWNIPGTDLRIFKINGTFPGYVPLYTGASEVGMSLVTFGRGGPRGAEVGASKGWLTTGTDGVVRWGANVVSSTQTFGGLGSLLVAEFNAIPGQNEATLSDGDSGGATFVLDGGQWKLAGINYGAEGYFDTTAAPVHTTYFSAALYDKGGFYEGSNVNLVWGLNPDLGTDLPASMYASRISTNLAAIQGIVAVPEPGSACLLGLAALGLLGRRRRR